LLYFITQIFINTSGILRKTYFAYL